MPLNRQLAVILFTDIVGYTALMGEDEQRAFDMLQTNRGIQKPLIEQYGGTWIKEIGDGVLASFTTVTDAVECACAILKACIDVPGLELRMGIHLGEVIFEKGDVFGDGVNIASRLQASAPVGGIWVSETIHNNVVNKRGIVTQFVKEEYLKNVREIVRIYEVNMEQTKISGPHPFVVNWDKPASIPEKSIAVLPFVNMSNDPEQEYFSDGMAEEILNSLTHLQDLKVAGRSSSFQFKGKNVDLREVGEKLGVHTVLEGSVRKQGNMLRVTVQLINAANGYHIWSERYDRPYDNIFAIQDEISLAITEKLKVSLFGKEKENIVKTTTTNNDAYDLYLKGRFFWNKRGGSLKTGLAYFQRAAETDPQFALAFAGIADAYMLLGFYDLMSPHESMPRAREAAEKAIQLDPSLAEGYTALAFVNMFYDWNWAGAKKNFEKIFSINPNYFPAYYWYSFYLAWVETKFEDAIRVGLKGVELEPLLPTSYTIIWSAYLGAGRNEEALRAIQTAFEMDASSFLLHYSMGMSLTVLGRYEEAIDVLRNALDKIMRHPWLVSELCWIYSLSADLPSAQKLYEELVLRSQTEYISGIYLFIAAYSSENFDKAFEFMEMAFEQKASFLVASRIWPTLEAMRIDPRFHAVIKKMKFPD